MSLDREKLLAYAYERKEIGADVPDVLENDCDIIEFFLDNCEITIPENNTFFVNVNCAKILNQFSGERIAHCEAELIEAGVFAGFETQAYSGLSDYSHTTPEWENVISLGFVGLRERVLKYAAKNSTDPKKKRFYDQVIRVYDAALRFLKRAAQVAEQHGKHEMAKGLINLCEKAPSNLFEAMQMSIAYYCFHHSVEGTFLRTLGRLDTLLYPYYVKEDKEKADGLIVDFLNEIDRLEAPANIPYAICGTDVDGNCTANELSYVLLDTYKKLDLVNTKFHILCSDNMPKDIIPSAFEGIRDGKNSIVFMSDKKIIEMLKGIGIEHEDAVNYHIVGCYECGGNNELTCTCNGKVNIPKAIEYALNKGTDILSGKQIGLDNDCEFETFDELYEEFKRQLVYLSNCAMKATDVCESHSNRQHCAPFFAAAQTSALEKGGDLYCDYTAKYNNSSINGIGLATAVDSLVAIKKLVYEDKTITLQKLKDILATNWEGEEALRLTIKNKFPKYGLGDEKTDAFAKDIVDVLADAIYKKPNVKGGIYRLGMFSIDWRWEMGEKTAASADGRLAGETLSQNASATFGADREGATAHLLSAAVIDYNKIPNGTVIDIDLHSSAVRGNNGINMLVSSLKTYFDLGGFAVHYNVLNTETLKEAKKNPDKYPNLQVRLCGWNVLFNSLSEKEKDEFIARSIK